MSSNTPTGWGEHVLPPHSIPARVLRVDGTILRVRTSDGPHTLRNTRKLPITVGDWLALDAGCSTEGIRSGRPGARRE